MKKIVMKRLIYTNGQGQTYIGGREYDGALSNENILGGVHELGKTQWIGTDLWLMRGGKPLYRITVEPFYQYEKSWYNLILDAFRRI